MPKIAIVDDRVTNRRILARLASELDSDITVETFDGPADALAWMRDTVADLVITDFKMPEMDGAAFIAALRQLAGYADVPVIVVTAYEDKSYRYNAFDAGATDFLMSPVDHKEFRARVRNLLTMRAQQLLLEERAHALEANLEQSNRLHRVEMRASAENLRHVVNSIPAMVSVVNADGTYAFVNNFMAWSLGITPAQAEGRKPDELLGAEAGAEQQRRDNAIFESGAAPPAFEHKFLNPTGNERYLLTVKTPLRDTGGDVTNVVTTSVDITDRHEVEVALKGQRNLLRHVLDLDPGIVFTVDKDGRIGLANHAIARAFGTTPQKMVGRNLLTVVPAAEEGRALLDDMLAALSNGEACHQQERRLTDSEGHQTWLKVAIVPFDDPQSGGPRALLVGTDISAMKEAETAMQEAKLAAELSNQSKSNFLATMSHELRTPLNAIMGFSQMINEQVLGAIDPPIYREYAQDIQSSATHLHSIISDILDVALIESGKFKLEESAVEVDTLFSALKRLLMERVKSNDVSISWRTATGMPALYADSQRIKQVLMNITSNAVKFTPPGGEIRVDADISADGGIRVTVVDTGIGMADEDIAAAMNQFAQVHSGLSRPYEGAGLGLPLSAALLDMHDAQMNIESSEGAGTVVTILFPPERTLRQRASNSE